MNSQTKVLLLSGRLTLMGVLVVLMALVALVTRGTATAVSPQAVSEDGLWHEVDEADIVLQGERWIVPQQYRTLALNLDDLQGVLAAAGEDTSVVITLPLPDGTFGRFQVTESHVMHPQLAAKFPEIKTYAGTGLDEATAIVRLDVTPAGFHAMILSGHETVYIDPYSRDDTTHYISYFRHDFMNPHEGYIQHEPLGDPAEIAALVEELEAGGGNIPSGDQLRTYRLAVAATGEYTQFHGGTVGDGMDAIVTAVNRVVGIYIRDAAINMQLVPNNNLIVYTDGATDPYTNNSGGTMLGQNQTNLDAVIGSANYDIGHVFSTGGGGVASLGVPCRAGLKARGVTGLPNPTGDPFYVDYVAHEMGHQYGANHTFNGSSGACAGGQWHGPRAYEPGSGTTIMAYAGICAPQNIQLNSDDHFHTGSIDEMRAYTVVGLGNSCPVITNTVNLPPVVNAGPDYNIPINTPFILSGSATDPNGDPLTYNWEQFDVGPRGHPNSPVGNAPLFRSFSSVLTSTRTFPQMSDIVDNTQTLGEILPFYGRNMRFRLTVRDNQPVAGGVDVDEVTLTVDGASGPFLVTAPNTAVTWNIGHTETVTWDVANTDQAPINCAEVDIRLSLDGGYIYPMLLEANRPNDGSEAVTVPNVTTSLARVRVQCSDNIFFDISNANFTIELGPTAFDVSKSVSSTVAALPGDPLQYTIVVTNTGMTGTAVITDVFDVALLDTSCNGVPGDLSDVQPLGLFEQVTYTCTAQIEPTLAVEMSKSVNEAMVEAGTAVTYTITITNPQSALTLTNITVDDPMAANCLPALSTPVTLGPSASQSYVCANNIITQTITNTATVTGFYEIVNIAGAYVSGDVGSLQMSNAVITAVHLEESAVAVVEVIEQSNYLLYLPFIMK